MNLAEIQRSMFDVIREPLTSQERTRKRTRDGESTRAVADRIIKPNDRLTSLERLEIYNRQYWFRLLSAFRDDFPGLRTLIGERRFERLSVQYLRDCPSRSFTLRNLGSHLLSWMQEHPEYVAGVEHYAADMVRLEWAEIEAFDGELKPVLSGEDLALLGDDPVFVLQPYVQLLELGSPLHEYLLQVRSRESRPDVTSNAARGRSVVVRRRRPRPPQMASTYLAVHRLEQTVYFKSLDRDGFSVLRGLQNGARLSVAMESLDWSGSPEQLAARIQQWFSNWAQLGWFCRTNATEEQGPNV